MTPKQVALVQNSFAKVALTSEAAAVLFYDRLFDIAPQMRAMFPDDMIEQRRKLIAMLAAVVKGLGNLEQVLPAASAFCRGFSRLTNRCAWNFRQLRTCRRTPPGPTWS